MSDNNPLDQTPGDYAPPDRVRFQDLEDLCSTEPTPAAPGPLPDPIASLPVANSPMDLGSPPSVHPDRVTPYQGPVMAQPIPARHRLRIMIGLLFLIVLVAVNLAIGSGKLLVEKVISESMEPTLLVGDRLLCDVNAVPRRYSVVVLKDPEDTEGKLVKRIMGLPGDRIQLRNGLLFVNGEQELSDKVSSNVINWDDVNINVPAGHVFVMGDNRNNSLDSLNFGPVPFHEVLGVVTAIVWPRSRWGRIEPFKQGQDGENGD